MKLTLGICQYDIHWNEPMANQGLLDELLDGKTMDLLVLPEMFDTGFLSNPTILKDLNAIRSKQWMKKNSRRQAIIGSVANKINGEFKNSLYVYHAENELIRYDKRHTFIGEESQNFTKGVILKSLDFQGIRIGLNICYDLRFPAWIEKQKADLLVFCANWPAKRKDHWKTLLKARAIENQCFVVGVNRIGKDGNGIEYSGESLIYDFEGKEILNLGAEEGVKTANLDFDLQTAYRQNFPVLDDKDAFDFL
jgi:omega-amidase